MNERRVEPGRALRDSFAIYSDDAGALITFAAAAFLPVALIGALLSGTGAVAGAIFTTLLAGPAMLIYEGAVAPTVVAARRDAPKPHPGDVLDFVQPLAGVLAMAGLLWIVAVMLGLVALIVPGLILITVWALVGPAIALERREVILAFTRSRDLVRGNGWGVFAAVIAVALLFAVATSLLQVLGGAIGGTPGAFLGGWIGAALTAPAAAILATVLFLGLGGSPEPAEEEEEERRKREAEEKRKEQEEEEDETLPPVT
jgi:hypothetical protein